MKDLIKTFGAALACITGMMVGSWVWDNVLEQRMDNLKENLANKRKEKGV